MTNVPRAEGLPAVRNPQRPEWTDRFEVAVKGLGLGRRVSCGRLNVDHEANGPAAQLISNKRSARHGSFRSGGWAQLVQIKCCDDEAKVEKAGWQFISIYGRDGVHRMESRSTRSSLCLQW